MTRPEKGEMGEVRGSRSSARYFSWLGFAVLLAILYAPVATTSVPQAGVEWLSSRQLVLLARSFGFSLGVTALAGVVAVLAALGTWRLAPSWRKRIGAISIALIAVPPYIHALSWLTLAEWLNGVLVRSGKAKIPFDGWVPAIWVQGFALLAIPLAVCLASMNTLGPDIIDSARLNRRPWEMVRKVILPLLAPTVGASLCVVFLLTLADYSVPSVFGLNVYSLEVFSAYSATGKPFEAAVLCWPILLVGMACLWMAFRWGWKGHVEGSSDGHAELPRLRLGGASDFGLAIACVAVVVLVIALVFKAGSPQGFIQSVRDAWHEIGVSLQVSLGAALVAVMFGFMGLGWLSSKRSATASHLFVALPLALPASLTGIGLAYLGTRSPLDALTGTLWMPILASAIRFAPLAALFLASWRGRLDPSVFDAAKVHASPLLTFFRVLLPLSLPATVATFGLCFALSLGELGATLLVYPPGEATVTLRVYNLLHYGAAENVAGLCLSMVALTLVGGWLATCGLRKR